MGFPSSTQEKVSHFTEKRGGPLEHLEESLDTLTGKGKKEGKKEGWLASFGPDRKHR